MDKSSIESKIKDRLHGHSEYIDNEPLFEALGIAERPKRRGFFWIPMLFLCGVIVGGAVFYLTCKESEIVSAPENINVEAGVVERIPQKVTSIVASKVDSQEMADIVELAEAKSSYSSMPIFVEEHQENVSQSSVEMGTSYGFRQKETPNRFQVIDNALVVNAHSYESTQEFAIPSKDNDLTNGAGLLPIAIVGTPSIGETFNLPQPAEQFNKSYLQMRWNEIHYSGEQGELERNLGDAIGSDVIFGEIERLSSWTVAAFLSYDKFRRELSAETQDLGEYLAVRSESEKELEQVGGGILMNYKLNNNWFAEFGLEFNQYNTRFSYSEYLYSSKQDTITYYRINYQGTTGVHSQELGEIALETERQWTIYNQLYQVQIPLSLGYELQKGRYSGFAQAGVNVGVYSRFVGSMFSREYRILQNPSFYKIAPNLSMELGIGGTYKLTEKASLYTKLRFRSSINSIASANNPLNERISQVGLALGCVYKL